MINFFYFVSSLLLEFDTDVFIGGTKRSFTYYPSKTNIKCNDLQIDNTTNVKVISSISNNVCIGNTNGQGFLKDYVLGKYKNYYIQHDNTVNPSANYVLDVLQSNVTFTKDVKLNEHVFKSYKYVPTVINTTCESLFGNINYTGVTIKQNNVKICVGTENGFNNYVLERFKTYEVEFDSRYRDEISVTTDNDYLMCENTCSNVNNINNGICDDGGPGYQYTQCVWGTDCEDCGPRFYRPPPASPPSPSPPPPVSPPPPPFSPPPPPHPPFDMSRSVTMESINYIGIDGATSSTCPGFNGNYYLTYEQMSIDNFYSNKSCTFDGTTNDCSEVTIRGVKIDTTPYFSNIDLDKSNPHLSCTRFLSNFINNPSLSGHGEGDVREYTWEGEWVVARTMLISGVKKIYCSMFGKPNYTPYEDYYDMKYTNIVGDCAIYSWTSQSSDPVLDDYCDGKDPNANYKWKSINNITICKRIECKNGYQIQNEIFYPPNDFSFCEVM